MGLCELVKAAMGEVVYEFARGLEDGGELGHGDVPRFCKYSSSGYSDCFSVVFGCFRTQNQMHLRKITLILLVLLR